MTRIPIHSSLGESTSLLGSEAGRRKLHSSERQRGVTNKTIPNIDSRQRHCNLRGEKITISMPFGIVVCGELSGGCGLWGVDSRRGGGGRGDKRTTSSSSSSSAHVF